MAARAGCQRQRFVSWPPELVAWNPLHHVEPNLVRQRHQVRVRVPLGRCAPRQLLPLTMTIPLAALLLLPLGCPVRAHAFTVPALAWDWMPVLGRYVSAYAGVGAGALVDTARTLSRGSRIRATTVYAYSRGSFHGTPRVVHLCSKLGDAVRGQQHSEDTRTALGCAPGVHGLLSMDSNDCVSLYI